MSQKSVGFYSGEITRVILLFLWVPTLIHCFRGSKFRKMMILMLVFIAYNATSMAMDYFVW